MAGADSAIRASDAERDAVIEVLRRHMADGRLTVDEFEERVTEALAARTRGDLDPVLRDLPPVPPDPVDPAPRRARRLPSFDWSVLPRVALVAVAVLGAVTLLARGDWWIIFPFFWIVGGMSRGGGVCGRSRHRGHAAAHQHGAHRRDAYHRTQRVWGDGSDEAGAGTTVRL